MCHFTGAYIQYMGEMNYFFRLAPLLQSYCSVTYITSFIAYLKDIF